MPFNPQGQMIGGDDSVSRRVAAITSADSPLMRQAQGIGLRTVNRRGLVNSSMAAGAATGAALDRAVPIASQEAQQEYGAAINSANLAAAERERVAAAVGQAAGDYSSGVAATLANPDIPASSRAAVQASQRDAMLSRISAIQRLYGVNIGWGQ